LELELAQGRCASGMAPKTSQTTSTTAKIDPVAKVDPVDNSFMKRSAREKRGVSTFYCSTPAESTYGYVTIFEAVVCSLVVIVQFSVHLIISRLCERVMTTSLVFLRGLYMMCAIGWGAGIFFTMQSVFIGLQPNFRLGAASNVMFGLCCTLLAVAVPARLGFVVLAMGGVVLHLPIPLAYAVVKGARLKAVLAFTLSFGLVFVVAINGFIACCMRLRPNPSQALPS
jgi:hypothetical protein